MPLYDFQCTKCEHVFEENTKSDATPPVCPECGGSTEKVISVPNFKVKQISDKALWHHKKAVADGVNVGFDVYKIRTRVTEQGATVEAGPETPASPVKEQSPMAPVEKTN